jgi:hypothetical protein
MAHLKILDGYFQKTQMSNIIKIHPVGAKSFHVGGQPDKHDETILLYIYIQQDAMLHSLFYQETALHVSAGTITHC